jgi:hypothetical protein
VRRLRTHKKESEEVNYMDPSGLSELEENILIAVRHVGWQADLWFPIVQREQLNFSGNAQEEEVHAALVGLVRRGLLKAMASGQDSSGIALTLPEWQPTSEGLADALALVGQAGRDLR